MIEGGEIIITPGKTINRVTGNSPKEVDVSVNKEGRHRKVGAFIEKNYPTEELAKEVEAKYQALSKAFRQAQLDEKISYFPLPGTCRRIGRKVITTKATREDEIIYDNHTNDNEIVISLNNPQESKDQAALLMDIARQSDVFTSKDTHALLVNKQTGIGKAMMLDFDSGSRLITRENESLFNNVSYQTQKNIINRQIDRFVIRK